MQALDKLRTLIITSIALACSCNVFARPISEDEACAVATRFYYMKKLGDDIRQVKSLHALNLVYSSRHGENVRLTPPEFYVFSPDNRKGFVIVAGDDRAKQIIVGYSLDSPISYQFPSSILSYLNCYIGYIEALRREEMNAKPKRKAQPVPPLIKTQWGQHAPYNYYCPEHNEQKALTGCVTTAVAQIMKFHAWPTQEKGSNYNWKKMKNRYSSSSKVRITEVARLMRDIGDAVEMKYGTILSGTNSSHVLTALTEHFHYAPSIRQIYRSQYNDEEWHRLIADELAAHRPIYYDGHSTKHDGHAFVVCGMDSDGLYYVNWGWEGLYDGYFDFEAVSTDNTSFQYQQSAIIGIRPQ